MSKVINVTIQLTDVPSFVTLEDIETQVCDALDYCPYGLNFVSATPAEVVTNGQEEDSDIRC